MTQFIAVTAVMALLAGVLWLLKSGMFNRFTSRSSAVAIETAVSLGERRQLVIVSVEGRRLLLGVTAGQVSLVTELSAAAAEGTRP
jgi:flagellar biogenesis protein FliO